MANTHWSATDQSAGITLSGGNLTATSPGTGSLTWVRAADKKLAGAGKFYWEFRANPFANGTSGHGFCASALSNPNGSSWSYVSGVDRNGAIYANGGYSGTSLGSTINVTVGVALDLTANTVWYRLAPSGNWNNSGTANPATGTGGFSVSAITNVDAVPVAMFGSVLSGDSVTANFGDTAFSGAVPSGFTAGWPGAAAPTGTTVSYHVPGGRRVGPSALLVQNTTLAMATMGSGVMQDIITSGAGAASPASVWVLA